MIPRFHRASRAAQHHPSAKLSGLLSSYANAIKYTHSGAVSLWCEKNADTVRVVVQDTGIGIGLSDQQNIFEEYYQVDNPARNSDHGVGLGLAIVKRACDLLDHPISLRSEPGIGSEFSIVLPKCDPAVTARLGTRGVLGDDTSLHGFVVVVIEDDENIAEAMNALLEECHCIPVVHADAAAAIAFLCTHRLTPQAIIADYRLHDGLTGVDAIEALRARYGTLPAALVSGEITLLERHDELRFAFPVMHKPLDLAIIKRLLHGFQSGAGIQGIGR